VKRRLFLAAIFLLAFPAWRFAEAAVLKGQVLLIGVHNETTPAVGVEVTLLETGDSVLTKAGGLFRLFLPDVFKAGERVRLSVAKKDWVIHYPLGGETLIPADLAKTIVPIRLLPKGSKRLWSDERIERFIQDTAEQAKQQVKLEGRPQDIDFSRYIKDWVTDLGFSVYEAKAEIDRWVAEVEQKQADFHQLGLAAYAKKHFGKANRLFTESAETSIKYHPHSGGYEVALPGRANSCEGPTGAI
jgi:hypothetical protein